MIIRKKILTATPMFSRSRNSKKLVSILCDASGSQKSKMAAHKQEYVYLSLYTTYLNDSRGYVYVFKVQEFNEADFSFCVMQAEVRNLSWRLTEIGNTHFSSCIQHICRILTAKHTYIKTQEFSEAILYIVRCKRRSEI